MLQYFNITDSFCFGGLFVTESHYAVLAGLEVAIDQTDLELKDLLASGF